MGKIKNKIVTLITITATHHSSDSFSWIPSCSQPKAYFIASTIFIWYKTIKNQIYEPKRCTNIYHCFATCGKYISKFSSIKYRKLLMNKHGSLNLKQIFRERHSPNMPLIMSCCTFPLKQSCK